MRYFALVIAAFLFTGCATSNVWNDFTGQGRGQSQLNMDSGACQLVAQSVPPTQSSGYCPKCAALNTMTTIMNQQNAYNACMQARGWARAS